MLVVEQQHAARAQRRRDAAGPRVERAQARERPVAEVDEIPASEQQLGRQRVDVGVHPRQLGLRAAAPPRSRPRRRRRRSRARPARPGRPTPGPCRRGGGGRGCRSLRAAAPGSAPASRARRGRSRRCGAHRRTRGGCGRSAPSQARSEKPPSTISVWPRIISASGEQRKVTASAMSSGLTSRPAGLSAPMRSISSRFGKCSSAPVSTTPPETAFARIPSGASSTAR